MSSVVVIGAGIGGLSSAALLAAKGFDVHVVEAGPRVGGKAGIETVDGVSFDTGPSVLTLPEAFGEIFASCGERFESHVAIRTLSPMFRYDWADGTRLRVFHEVGRTLAEVGAVLGPEAEQDLARFLVYARGVWEAASPRFVYGSSVDWTTLFTVPVGELVGLTRVDPLRTMRAGIARHVRSPHLRTLLERYATYNGSDPRVAPATLNCIAHVELALGGYGVEGGIHRLPTALWRLAERHGATLQLGTPVARIQTAEGRVVGVELGGGRVLRADAVVCNADVGHLVDTLLPEARRAVPTGRPSTSGWTAVVGSSAAPFGPHAVAFPEVYEREFADLFDRERAPEDPTVYACDQSLAHGRRSWSDGRRPVFLMANAPAVSEPSADWRPLRERVLERAVSAGWIHPDDPVVWERTPHDLAVQFPGSAGALYGVASNSRLAAFRRAPNRVRAIPGLYLASGSAHPGGGLPLCALSGRQAAEAVVADLGGAVRRPRSASMVG